jgi:hypothetical protein
MTATARSGRRPAGARFRRPSPATWAGLLGGLVALSAAALLPLFLLTHERTDVVTPLVIGLPAGAVGVLVARRQPRNPLGWLFLGITACLLLGTDGGLYAVLDYRLGRSLPFGPVGLVLYQLWGPGIFLFGLVILLFPDGRLPSAWWRRMLWGYVALYAFVVVTLGVATVGAMTGPFRVDADGGLVATDDPGGWYGAVQGVTLLLAALFWLCFIGRQVLSWRRSSGERRQQLKWLMSGAVIALASAVLSTQIGIAWLGFAALPVGIGVGILKYRLYDIDRLISRTLAYAIVTGLLVGVYTGLVLLATRVLPFSSSVAVAGSTLVAVALLRPLRRRVQRAVDRRFNRARYNADKTVAAFAARLQNAVDLDTVRADLAGVVHGALQPTHVSVWIAGSGPG